MNRTAVLQLIQSKVNEFRDAQGLPPVAVEADAALLDGSLDIDSLDLAGLVVALEAETKYDPFADGFIDFRTAGDLADLFTAEDQ